LLFVRQYYPGSIRSLRYTKILPRILHNRKHEHHPNTQAKAHRTRGRRRYVPSYISLRSTISSRPILAYDKGCPANLLSPGAFYFFNPLRTPAVSNIEKRFSSGGGTPDHTPAIASPRGRPNQVQGKQEGDTGINTPHYAEKIGEQTPQVSYEMLLQKPNAHRLTHGISGNGNAEGIREAAIPWQGQWD